jgi:hypothetical protein
VAEEHVIALGHKPIARIHITKGKKRPFELRNLVSEPQHACVYPIGTPALALNRQRALEVAENVSDFTSCSDVNWFVHELIKDMRGREKKSRLTNRKQNAATNVLRWPFFTHHKHGVNCAR